MGWFTTRKNAIEELGPFLSGMEIRIYGAPELLHYLSCTDFHSGILEPYIRDESGDHIPGTMAGIGRGEIIHRKSASVAKIILKTRGSALRSDDYDLDEHRPEFQPIEHSEIIQSYARENRGSAVNRWLQIQRSNTESISPSTFEMPGRIFRGANVGVGGWSIFGLMVRRLPEVIEGTDYRYGLGVMEEDHVRLTFLRPRQDIEMKTKVY